MRLRSFRYCMLVGLLYTLVAFRPLAVSREVIVLLGLLQLVEAVLLFVFAGSMAVALLLITAALCVLAGAAMRPREPLPSAGPPIAVLDAPP